MADIAFQIMIISFIRDYSNLYHFGFGIVEYQIHSHGYQLKQTNMQPCITQRL